MQWTTAYSEAVHTFANTISTTERRYPPKKASAPR